MSRIIIRGTISSDVRRSCCICATVLVDAVTLGSCGHSVCKKCVLRDLSSACKKCGTAYEPFNTDPMDEESNIKLSILVCELTNKYWEKEKQAVQLRNEGNKLFQRGDVGASLVKYSEAYQLSKDDHLITSQSRKCHRNPCQLESQLSYCLLDQPPGTNLLLSSLL